MAELYEGGRDAAHHDWTEGGPREASGEGGRRIAGLASIRDLGRVAGPAAVGAEHAPGLPAEFEGLLRVGDGHRAGEGVASPSVASGAGPACLAATGAGANLAL